ncbi:MAG: nucleoside-diphosphate kinase [Holosporales bacterium]|jgi:nucleoside-diphosphate kinase|nr:nucleoside-diphosphate kinase [Holosporales bacterium]
MSVQQTLSIIKPDAVRRNLIGKINDRIESADLKIIAQKMIRLTKEHAMAFYDVHAERSFYNDLCSNMTLGPIVAQVLDGENAIERYREVMGATNPGSAAPGTIRHEFGESVDFNSVHGSDSPETALKEIAFFFSRIELHR